MKLKNKNDKPKQVKLTITVNKVTEIVNQGVLIVVKLFGELNYWHPGNREIKRH